MMKRSNCWPRALMLLTMAAAVMPAAPARALPITTLQHPVSVPARGQTSNARAAFATPKGLLRRLTPSAATTLQSETFNSSATTANAWSAYNGACLTAGNTSTPSSSIRACGSAAAQDAAGSGALQLTSGTTGQSGMVVSTAALPTANGLQITLADYSFNGSSPGADGLAIFLTDASKPLPTAMGKLGASLGYAGTPAGASGVANGYVGIGLDEYGNFTSSSAGPGGTGQVPETIGVRGSAPTLYQYLGGATNSLGVAATLPFKFDQPLLTTRPALAPLVTVTLTAAGTLSVAVDRQDGNGPVLYYARSIVGVGGQPTVPAYVHLGFSASTGGKYNTHQIGNLTVATAPAGPAKTAFDNPPQLVSANGSLTFNVSAQSDPATGRPTFNYAGSTVPPTLRLLPGDTLKVNFTNNLPAPPSGSGYTNNVNLHYHGLHVSPQAPADDSIDMLAAPGQSLSYVLQIPAAHPPGLYWYHSHAHGEAERQTLSGMSGAIIIDGIAAYTPQIANMTERVLLVRDAPLPGQVLPNANINQVYAMKWAMQHGVSMHSAFSRSGSRPELRAKSTMQSRNPYVITDPGYRRFIRPQATSGHCVAGSAESPVHALTVNGVTQPALDIAPNEQQFWRVVNAGADTYLDVQVDHTNMQIVALDGVPLSSGIGTPAAMTVTHWVLPPSSRVEFIVTGPQAGSKAYLRTNCFDPGPNGIAMPATVLASINSIPPPMKKSAVLVSLAGRISPKARRFRFHTASTIKSVAVSATRTIYYSDQNTINGAAYDPAAPPQFYAQSGTVEQWTIVNNSSQVHTFHIHQIHFVVQAINGTRQSQQFVLDNVNVPAATASGPGSVQLLLDFTDPVIIGTFLVHCHILSHEDGGMMAKIRVGTAPPIALSATSVNFANSSAAPQTVTVSGGTVPYSLSGCSGVANAAVTGSTISILPAGAGSCVLTVADSSNPSISATIVIAVGAGPPVVTLSSTSVSFAAPTAPAQSIAINGGTTPYAAAGCAGTALASISGSTLKVTPQAAGTCSLVVADAANNQATLAVSVNAPVNGAALDNLTFHRDALRTGWYANESTLTMANVNPTLFGQVATLAAPAGMPGLGKVYAQPLFVSNEHAVDGNAHNLVIVAGSAGQVYAFDETTRAVVWHRSFTNAAAGIRQQLWTDTSCSDVNPDVGIIGTPVADRTLDTMYVVVATVENGVPFTRLHALGLGNGADVINPTVIQGTVTLATGGAASVSSIGNMNRSGLLEANGNIYVALGSHCDQNAANIHGWMAAYSATTLTETGSLVDFTNANDGTNYFLGSPWMSGFGPSADAAGNVYFATGNGMFNGTTDFAMSVLKVPGNLNLAAGSFFSPIQELADSSADEDLGAGGVVLLPDQPGPKPHVLIAGGKCSANAAGCFKYILNRDALGGQQTGNAGALWSANTGGSLWGGPAYFVDSAGVQHIEYGGNPLNTYTLTTAPFGLSLTSSTNVGCLECRDSGSQPIVSSNGTHSGSAIVWALKTPTNAGGTITLYAFNPFGMATPLYSAAAGQWTKATGTGYVGGALVSPVVADGRVYVPTEGSVSVFGLLALH